MRRRRTAFGWEALMVRHEGKESFSTDEKADDIGTGPNLLQGPDARAGVIAAAVYQSGKRICDIPISDAHLWRQRENTVIWIGLHEPDRVLLEDVQREFDLHPLAIEDASHAHQRPKLEIYGDAMFVVARTAHMMDSEIVFGETHLF